MNSNIINNTLDPLSKLAIKYGADKGPQFHYYTPVYDRIFSPLRNSCKTLLEIGVFQGASLNMWADYFSNAKIFGVDINPGCMNYVTDRIGIYIGNQADQYFLESFLNGISLDIVIDDGSHFVEDQIASFEIIFPYVQSGGVYVVEDISTSYWPEFHGGWRKPHTSIEYFKNKVDDLNFNGFKGETYARKHAYLLEKKEQPNYYEKHIESISFYNSLVFIYKR